MVQIGVVPNALQECLALLLAHLLFPLGLGAFHEVVFLALLLVLLRITCIWFNGLNAFASYELDVTVGR